MAGDLRRKREEGRDQRRIRRVHVEQIRIAQKRSVDRPGRRESLGLGAPEQDKVRGRRAEDAVATIAASSETADTPIASFSRGPARGSPGTTRSGAGSAFRSRLSRNDVTLARRTSAIGFQGTPRIARTVIQLEITTAPAAAANPVRAGTEKRR
jgi:hypothetical protein